MILLDTHVVHWMAVGDPRLGPKASRQIQSAAAGILQVSSVSFWELGLHVAKNRLVPQLSSDVRSLRKDLVIRGFGLLPLDVESAIHATELANFHADPADRFLVAVALTRNFKFMTADRKILQWSGALDSIDAEK